MTGWTKIKTIIEDDSVAVKRDTTTKQFPRFEQLWIGATWLIARVGDKLGALKEIDGIEYHLHVIASRAEDLPELTLLYSVGKDNIIIHDIGVEIGKEAIQSATITKIH